MFKILHNLVIRNIKGIPYFFIKNHNADSAQQHYALVGKLSASLLHDILTPLTSLSLGAAAADKSNDMLIPIMDRSSAQIKEFVEIMRDFLNEIGQESTVHINAEIRKSIRLMSHKAVRHNVQIQFLELHQVRSRAHPLYIYQILVNLLSNAIDASADSQDKKIIVILKKMGKQYSIECKDFGNGIPAEHVRRICKPGFTTKPDGFGLGLFSVKRIVTQQLHGRFHIHSEPGDGSLFSCRIPIRD